MRAVVKLHGPRIDPQRAMEHARRAIIEESHFGEGVTYITCFQGTDLRWTLIAIVVQLTSSVFGLDFLSNGSYFIILASLSSKNSLILTIGEVASGCAANVVGIWTLSRVPRRKAIMTSLCLAGILWGAVGVSGFWSGQIPAWTAVSLFITIIIVCDTGCWPGSYAVIAETSSLRTRSFTQGIGSVATQAAPMFMAIILPYIYNPDAAALGMRTDFVFCGLRLLKVGLLWFVLLEMKDRSMADIDHMFEIRLLARQFTQWKRDEDHEHW